MYYCCRQLQLFPLNKSPVVNVLIYEVQSSTLCHNRSISNEILFSPSCVSICLCTTFPLHRLSNSGRVVFHWPVLPLSVLNEFTVALWEQMSRFSAPLSETSATFSVSPATWVCSTCQNPTTKREGAVYFDKFRWNGVMWSIWWHRPPRACALILSDCVMVKGKSLVMT